MSGGVYFFLKQWEQLSLAVFAPLLNDRLDIRIDSQFFSVLSVSNNRFEKSLRKRTKQFLQFVPRLIHFIRCCLWRKWKWRCLAGNSLHATVERVIEVLHHSVGVPGNCNHAAQTCDTKWDDIKVLIIQPHKIPLDFNIVYSVIIIAMFAVF